MLLDVQDQPITVIVTKHQQRRGKEKLRTKVLSQPMPWSTPMTAKSNFACLISFFLFLFFLLKWKGTLYLPQISAHIQVQRLVSISGIAPTPGRKTGSTFDLTKGRSSLLSPIKNKYGDLGGKYYHNHAKPNKENWRVKRQGNSIWTFVVSPYVLLNTSLPEAQS